MSDDPRHMTDSGYRWGITEAHISALQSDLNEIKRDVKEMRRELESLMLWRAWIVGVSAAVATVAAYIVSFLMRSGGGRE